MKTEFRQDTSLDYISYESKRWIIVSQMNYRDDIGGGISSIGIGITKDSRVDGPSGTDTVSG